MNEGVRFLNQGSFFAERRGNWAGERLHTAWSHPVLLVLTLAVAIVAMRWPFAWTGNEENYFLLAHRLVDPAAYGPFDPAFDGSRGKWLGLLMFGSAVSLFGFASAHALLAALSILVTAAGLAAVARMLQLGILPALAVLTVFMALGQSIVGGEWFVGGAETKAFAYGFGLLGLAAAGGGRTALAALLAAIAAYFHFLVGGFWLVCITLFLFNREDRRGHAPRFSALSLLLLSPLVVALAWDVVEARSVAPPVGSPTADYIYSILRAPHHVAPFASKGGWPQEALKAAALGLALMPLAWWAAGRSEGALKPLLRTVGLVALLLPLATALSWFDREAGALGKFYLFRPASPLLLLLLFSGAALLAGRLRKFPLAELLWVALIAGSVMYLRSLERPFPWPPSDRDVTPLVEAVRQHTRPEQLVLIDPKLDRLGGNSLPRLLGRPTYISWKFVPTNPADIYRWHARIERRQKLFDRGCPTHPRVGALIIAPASAAAKARCGRLVYRNERAAVLAIGDKSAASIR